tara:strand:+ start:62 stop:457 length:396 start_codon:yes stop_codon:yes gene_type:complete
MSWESLPIELRVYILSERYKIRNNLSKKIQNVWQQYIIADIEAINILLDVEIDEDQQIMVSIPETSIILKKCAWICSGKQHLWFWKEILDKIQESLVINKYEGTQWLTPNAVNYRKTKIEYKKLLKKFNME